MPAYLGNTDLQTHYLGSTPIDELYFGSTKIWPSGPPSPYNIFIAGNDDNIDMNEALLSFEMYKSILSIADFDSGKELIEAYKEKKDFFESNFFRGNVGTNEFNDIVFENEDFDPKGFHFVLTGNFKKDPTKKKLEAGLTEKGLFLEKSLNNKVNLIQHYH
jgi:hypothetical protein